MPNRHYIKGRRKEYAVCNKLKDEGYDIAQRSAGSHSPIDIFAISRTERIIKLVQCKPDNFNSKKIESELEWLKGNFRVEFEVL